MWPRCGRGLAEVWPGSVEAEVWPEERVLTRLQHFDVCPRADREGQDVDQKVLDLPPLEVVRPQQTCAHAEVSAGLCHEHARLGQECGVNISGREYGLVQCIQSTA